MAGPTTALRPRCACCNKRYGSRRTEERTVYQQKGAPEPSSPATNLHIIKVQRHTYGSNMDCYTFTMWDGESFILPYEPFCSLKCALHYARRTYDRIRRGRC